MSQKNGHEVVGVAEITSSRHLLASGRALGILLTCCNHYMQ